MYLENIRMKTRLCPHCLERMSLVRKELLCCGHEYRYSCPSCNLHIVYCGDPKVQAELTFDSVFEPRFSRQHFMNFFRNDVSIETLTVEDREEIFRTILLGSSDLTVELFNEILNDYDAGFNVQRAPE